MPVEEDANVATVDLRSIGDRIQIEVRDDGKGFDPELAEPGIGLIGMRERVLGLGGQLEILSKPAEGTTVIIELPTAKPKHQV